jgi:hypothetical protein
MRGGAPANGAPDSVDPSLVQPAAAPASTSAQRPAATRSQSSGTPARQVSTERLDGIFTGAVDLASGIVSAVAGDRAGARTRQALSGVADELKDALATSDALNGRGARNSGAPPADQQTSVVSPSRGQSSTGGPSPDAVQADPWSGQAERGGTLAAARGQGDPAASQVSWAGARGPPATLTDLTDALHDVLRTATTTSPNVRLPRLGDKTSKAITASAADFTQNLIEQLGGTVTKTVQAALTNGSRPGAGSNVQHKAPADWSGAIRKPVENFLQDLFERLGKAKPETSAGQIHRANQGGMSSQRPSVSNLDDALSQFVDVATGIVSDIAGNKAAQQTRRALSDLTDQLNAALGKMNKPGNGSATSSPGSGGSRNTAADLASSIQESANNFVGDLLQRLGITKPGATTGNQATANQSAQPAPSQNVSDVLSRFVDVATGIVSDIAGKKAGKQTQEALSELTDQLTAGLTNPKPTGNSSTGSTSQPQPQTDLASSIGELVNNFVGDLLQLLGVNKPSSSSGQQTSSNQSGANQSGSAQGSGNTQQPANLDDALSHFVDVATNIVTDVAGKKAGKHTHEALSDLTDELTDSLGSHQPNSGSDSSNTGSTNQPQPQTDLASSIGELVNNFVGDLLQLLGVNKPSSSGQQTSSNQSGSNQSGSAQGSGNAQQPAPSVDDAMTHFVDLASGIVSDIAGSKAGKHTHEALSDLTDELTDSHKPSSNAHSSNTGSPARPKPQTDLAGTISESVDNFVGDLLQLLGVGKPSSSSQQTGANQSDSAEGSANTQQPANLDDALSHFVDVATNIVTDVAGKKAGKQTHEALSELTEQLTDGLTNPKPTGNSNTGSTTQPNPQANLASAIRQSVDNFVGDLLQLLGVNTPSGSAGQQGGSGQGSSNQGSSNTQQPAPSVDDAMTHFVDLASGIVSEVAGNKAGKHTQQALTDLTDQLTAGPATPSSTASGQNVQVSHNTVNNLATTIGDSAGSFVGDLLQELGLSRPGRSDGGSTRESGDGGQALQRARQHGGGIADMVGSLVDSALERTGGILDRTVGRATADGHQQRPTERPRSGATPGSIADATDNFVQDLLQRLGVGQQQGGSDQGSDSGQPTRRQQGGQQQSADEDQDDLQQMWRDRPGRQNASGISQGRPATLDDFGQVLSGVVDAVSGIVTVAAGKQAGAQARQMLTAAAEDVLAALQAANTGQNGGMSGGGDGGQATDGQDSGWSLGTDGQFAGTECQSNDECALVDGTLKPRQPGSLGSRAPPPLLADDTTNPDQQYKLAAWWQDTSSSTGVNQALTDRLAVIKGQQGVDDAKAQLAKGSITKAAYDEKVSAQQALQTKADGSKAQLSPYDSQLIDETIKGQQGLTTAKTKLDADKKQLDAGKLDKATYDQHAAEYAAQRDQVYAQTEQLRDATGGSGLQQPGAGQDGAGASCATSGAFGECATTSADATTGQWNSDRSLCLVGVSGCSSSSRTGDRVASASCDVSGCKTNSTAGKTAASATCGAGDCNTETVADSRGADTFCQARGGCTTSGQTPTKPDAADLAAGKTEGTSEATGTCTKNCALASFANQADAGSDCNTSNGTCDTSSTGRRATETAPAGTTPAGTGTADPAATAAAAAQRAKENGEASSKAHCQANTVGCNVTTTVRAGVTETGQRGWLADLLYGDDDRTSTTSTAPAAEAAARCGRGATGCTGNTETSTGGKTEHTDTTAATPAVAADPATGQAAVSAVPAKTNTDNRTQSGTATCQVNGGSCTSSSGLGDDEGALANSGIECDRATGCSGKASTATQAEITAGIDGKTATRKTDAHHECTVGGATGDCANDSSSTVGNSGPAPDTNTAGYTRTAGYNAADTATTTPAAGTPVAPKVDPVAELAKGLTAHSRTTATLSCGSADCKATESGASSGAASGDVTGTRDSDGVTKCAVHGVGGTCGSVSDTEVTHREAQPAADGKPATPAGPVSVSHADAQVRCTDSKECGGTSYAETSALDTAVSKDRRGSSTGADCTVKGGGCLGQASSDASTVAEYVQLDPKTGQPIKGQPTSGPTSTSRSAASVDCQATNCEGTARTTAAAWDGAVDGGKPRTSEGTVGCAKGATSCQVQTLSNATTGPGAALTYAGGDQAVNADRLGTGPSAASTIGGKMVCDGDCGSLTGTVLATNPGVSADPRGNRAEGSCSGASGGTCTAVVNGGASSGPDANVIKPMVQDQPTQNATTTDTALGGGDTTATAPPRPARVPRAARAPPPARTTARTRASPGRRRTSRPPPPARAPTPAAPPCRARPPGRPPGRT